MKKVIWGFSRLAAAISGGMLAAIFGIFLLQIVLRYFFTPAGWTLELIGILWVWVIFFACAFAVREADHVKFDIIYLSVGKRTRRIFALISAAALVIDRNAAVLVDYEERQGTSTQSLQVVVVVVEHDGITATAAAERYLDVGADGDVLP